MIRAEDARAWSKREEKKLRDAATATAEKLQQEANKRDQEIREKFPIFMSEAEQSVIYAAHSGKHETTLIKPNMRIDVPLYDPYKELIKIFEEAGYEVSLYKDINHGNGFQNIVLKW